MLVVEVDCALSAGCGQPTGCAWRLRAEVVLLEGETRARAADAAAASRSCARACKAPLVLCCLQKSRGRKRGPTPFALSTGREHVRPPARAKRQRYTKPPPATACLFMRHAAEDASMSVAVQCASPCHERARAICNDGRRRARATEKK